MFDLSRLGGGELGCGTSGATQQGDRAADFRTSRANGRGWMTVDCATAISEGSEPRPGGMCPNATGRKDPSNPFRRSVRLWLWRLEPVSTAGSGSSS